MSETAIEDQQPKFTNHRIDVDVFLNNVEAGLSIDRESLTDKSFSEVLATCTKEAGDKFQQYQAIQEVLITAADNYDLRKLSDAIDKFNQETGKLYIILIVWTAVMSVAALVSAFRPELHMLFPQTFVSK